MHLSYEDSTVETLGQWDPTDIEPIMKVYEAIDGVLVRLVFHTRLEDNCLRRQNIDLISVEVVANTSQPQTPGDFVSDHSNSCDPESASMEETISRCEGCGRWKCSNSTLRRKSMVETFDCSRPGQVSR